MVREANGNLILRLGVRYEPLTNYEAMRIFEGIIASINDEQHKGHLRP